MTKPREVVIFSLGCLTGTFLAVASGAVGFAVFSSKVWRDAARGVMTRASRSGLAAPGTPARYDWEVVSLDGASHPMKSVEGKVVLLNFWATWCGPCRRELPSLQRLYEKTRDLDVAFVLVSGEDAATVKDFLSRNSYTMPVYTMTGSPPSVFHASGIPCTFLLAKDGTIAKADLGSREWDGDETLSFLKRLSEGSSPASRSSATAPRAETLTSGGTSPSR